LFKQQLKYYIILFADKKEEMSVILYIDETEFDDFFIVAGILTTSKKDTDNTYKKFKKKVKNMPLSPREKEKVFTKFKSTLLDKKYQRIKIHMLEHINKLNYQIIYSVYLKKGVKMNQEIKEKEYIKLLNNIINDIDQDIDIIFDSFNKKDFHKKIIENISLNKNVHSIIPQDSRLEYGLQFVDNICSSIRLFKTNSNLTFYEYIEKNTKEV